jgi:hypothetical protein
MPIMNNKNNKNWFKGVPQNYMHRCHLAKRLSQLGNCFLLSFIMAGCAGTGVEPVVGGTSSSLINIQSSVTTLSSASSSEITAISSSSAINSCADGSSDLLFNDLNCGTCGTSCPEGRSCDGGICSGVIGDGPDGCSGLAHSIHLTKLALMQNLEVPIMTDGSEIIATLRNADVVQSKAATLRVFFDLGSEWINREVSVRLYLNDGDSQHTLYKRQFISEASTQNQLGSTIQIPVSADLMTSNARYAVEVVECESSVGPLLGARFPAIDDISLGALAVGPLKVAFVPVSFTNLTDNSVSDPDISEQTINYYTALLEAMYPVTEIQSSITEPISYSSTLADFDIGAVLDIARAKRSADGPANNVHYVGLIKPTSTFFTLCGRNACTLGIGYLAPPRTQTSPLRVAVSLAYGTARFGGVDSADIIAHELGHTLNRPHAPCGIPVEDADASFPYSNGGIGVWGYDARSGSLIDPNTYTDIMGYCDPTWVSDYTVKAISSQLVTVNNLPGASFKTSEEDIADDALAQPWLVAFSGKKGLRWGTSIDKAQAPFGIPESAFAIDTQGVRIAEITVYVVTTSEGTVTMLVPKPQPSWHSIAFPGRGALVFDHSRSAEN